MTIKELKEFINSIDSKYDNEKVIMPDMNYTEYCLGDGYEELKIDKDWSYFIENKGFYIDIDYE